MRDTLEKVTKLADTLEYFYTNPILKETQKVEQLLIYQFLIFLGYQLI